MCYQVYNMFKVETKFSFHYSLLRYHVNYIMYFLQGKNQEKLISSPSSVTWNKPPSHPLTKHSKVSLKLYYFTIYYLIGSENSKLTVNDTNTVVENKLGEISYLSSEIQYTFIL